MNPSGALRPARRALAVTGAALLGVCGLAAPAAAHVTAGAIGEGRTGANVAAVVGLVGVVVGGLALARSAGRLGTGSGRAEAVTATAAGLLGMFLAGLHLATSTGGFGTGNGRAGAIVALVVGLIAISLGALALTRRRTA